MTDLLTPPAPAIAVPRKGYAPLTNMALMLRTAVDVIEANEETQRLGVFYGDSGFGKSVAAAFVAARLGALYVEAMEIWNRRAFLEALAEELGIVRPAREAWRLFKQIVDELNRNPRTLIIDETDHLVNKKMVELIRGIHDSTPIVIIMIGEEQLLAKLKEWGRFDNRIHVATPAQPASIEDALMLRDHYGLGDLVADNLVAYFAQRCRGVTRRIVKNLRDAQRLASVEGVERMDREWWGTRPVSNGDIQTRRSMGA